jgi:hypothetical protein
MGAKSRAVALTCLQPQPGGPPLLAVATGPYVGKGFDCPALNTLFLAAPVANHGSLTQYVGRILRSHENKTTAEVHGYLDERTGVLAAMLAKRAPGYAGLGFPTRARSHSLQAPSHFGKPDYTSPLGTTSSPCAGRVRNVRFGIGVGYGQAGPWWRLPLDGAAVAGAVSGQLPHDRPGLVITCGRAVPARRAAADGRCSLARGPPWP